MTVGKITFPLTTIVLITIVSTIYQVLITCYGGEVSPNAARLYVISYSFLVAWFIELDRKQRAVSAPFEFAAFVFFAWPVIAPYYLFKTRRWFGLGLGLNLIMFSFVPDMAALITYFLKVG
ncbi:MAG: hypothetical protein ACJ8NR_13665 [Sulfurifustis sp.]